MHRVDVAVMVLGILPAPHRQRGIEDVLSAMAHGGEEHHAQSGFANGPEIPRGREVGRKNRRKPEDEVALLPERGVELVLEAKPSRRERGVGLAFQAEVLDVRRGPQGVAVDLATQAVPEHALSVPFAKHILLVGSGKGPCRCAAEKQRRGDRTARVAQEGPPRGQGMAFGGCGRGRRGFRHGDSWLREVSLGILMPAGRARQAFCTAGGTLPPWTRTGQFCFTSTFSSAIVEPCRGSWARLFVSPGSFW